MLLVFLCISQMFLFFTACALDLVFVLGVSYTQSPSVFTNMLSFVANVVSQMNIGPNGVRVGVVTYGFFGTDRIFLNSYSTASSLVQAIQAISATGDWSNLANGLNQAYTSQFTTANGDRANVQNVVVVIAPAKSDQGTDGTISTANILKNAGIRIFAVGMNNADATEMQSISSSPQTLGSNYFMLASDTQLSSLVNTMYSTLCPQGSNCPGICLY